MNDIRVTKYALGELAGKEREAFERELAASESLQQELSEVVRMTEVISHFSQPTEGLDDGERSALLRRCLANLRYRKRLFRGRLAVSGGLLAAAACLVLMVSWDRNAPQKEKAVAVAPIPPEVIEAPAPEVAVVVEAKAEPSPSPSVVAEPVPAQTELAKNEPTPVEQPVLAGVENEVQKAEPDNGLQAGTASKSSGNSLASATEARSAGQVAGPIGSGNAAGSSPPPPLVAAVAPPAVESSPEAAFFQTDDSAAGADTSTQEKQSAPFAYVDPDQGMEGNVYVNSRTLPYSTFSPYADPRGYARLLKLLQSGQLPSRGSVHIEDLINFFRYTYPAPAAQQPFSVTADIARAPWDLTRHIVRIGIKGATHIEEANDNSTSANYLSPARKVATGQMSRTAPMLNGVKIRVEFIPLRVSEYRLIGYEQRSDVPKDSGDKPASSGEVDTVTALYEVVVVPPPSRTSTISQRMAVSNELLRVTLLYTGGGRPITAILRDSDLKEFRKASPDFQFATAVAGFGMKLRGVEGSRKITWGDIERIARTSVGDDPDGQRAAFFNLVETAKLLDKASK